MHISTRGEYGMRAMLDLALHYNQGPITLKSIATRQGISESYLGQLATVLRKAGLVLSCRGAQGGYELTREPAQIKISDIIQVLEGPLSPVECLAGGSKNEICRNSDRCAARLFWQKLRDTMIAVLDATTLADLAQTSRELNQEGLMFYI